MERARAGLYAAKVHDGVYWQTMKLCMNRILCQAHHTNEIGVCGLSEPMAELTTS